MEELHWPLNDMVEHCTGPLECECFSVTILEKIGDIYDILEKLPDEPYSLKIFKKIKKYVMNS